MVTIVRLRRSFGKAGLLRDSTAALTIGLVVAALVWALLEQVVTVATGGWSWITFAQSAMKNLSFALLLGGVVALLRTQRSHDTPPATAPPARHRQVSADELVRDLADITDIADDLGLIPDASGLAAPRDNDTFEYLDSVRWSLANYVLRGDRTRRLANAPYLLIEPGQGNDDDLVCAARTLRTRADQLADQIQYTNTVVSDWLVAHRVAVANPCYLDSNALFDRYRRGELDPSAIGEDPLYLLICHLHDVLEAVEDDVDAPWLEPLRAQLTLPLRAVQQEIAAAMAYGAAAIGVTRAVARTQAT
ncbi:MULTISPECIES: hypothetical protein [unclassified Mycobacterium]|uniref:hypothetical protein n=1 Tax=unclassified Mycobacterium TaxID=2642494 RepID=UPI0029C9ABDE|nr:MULTISPECIES: hypothetical protein [unclassified Mycobacterium]